MDYNNDYEQEIDLKDLLFAVLHKWKPILLAAVVCAVLLGGYKGFTTYQHQNDPEVIAEADEKYQTELETYEKKLETAEREIENLKTDIAEQQEYLEKSVLMNISAYDVGEAKTDLFVKTDYVILPNMAVQNINYTDTILKAYKSYLDSAEFLGEIAQKAGIETRYLKELVDITIGSNMISIQVKHDDQYAAKAVLDDIMAGVENAGQKISDSINTHTVSVVNESVGSVVDLNLADTQKAESDRLLTLNETLETKLEEMEKLEEPKKAATSAKAAVTGGIKFAVVGGVLGAFMVVFVVCVVFLMNGKIYSANELRSRFKVKILGVLPGEKKARGIDAWLNRLEGRAQGPAEHEYVLIAANIRNYAAEGQTILVTGTAAGEKIRQAAEALAKELTGMKVIAGGNMLQDAETLRRLPETDGVVLVEQCNVSAYGKIELEIEKTSNLEKEVLGCVVFE